MERMIWRRKAVDKKLVAVVESDVQRLDKLQTYYEYFSVEQRYSLSFKDFCRKVDDGIWVAYLAG
jgi:hypothetical protein